MILDNQERILFFIFQRMGCASSKADVVECREEHSTPLEELNIDKQSTSVKEEPVESIQQKQNVASALPDMADKGSAPPTNEIPTCRSDSLISPIQCPAEMDSIPRISSLSQQQEIVSSNITIDQDTLPVEPKRKFSSESAFADVTDQDSEHPANCPDSLPTASNSISPLDSPDKPLLAYQLPSTFWSLSKQDKINALNRSLDGFSLLSQQAETSADLFALLNTMYSIVVLETDAYGKSLSESVNS